MYSPDRNQRRDRIPGARRARGAMLVELMVGLAVAVIAIGAAMASLAVAREAVVAVHEIAQLQQRASHALRVLGMQIRSAGSFELQAAADTEGPFSFVGLGAGSNDTAAVHGTDGGNDTSDTLRLAHVSPPLIPSQQQDCLGQKAEPGRRVEARFHVDAKGNLRCKGITDSPQPLVGGVAAFKLRYRVREGERVRSMAAADVEAAGLWAAVTALEACIELRGSQRSSSFDRQYLGCNGRTQASGDRLNLVARKLFVLAASTGA